MMRKNIVIALAAVTALGCPAAVSAEENAGSILEKMEAAMEEAKYFSGSLNIDLPLSMEADGMTLEIPITMKGSVRSDIDAKMAEVNMDLSMSMMGEESNQAYNLYVTEEGTYTQENGEDWYFEASLGDDGDTLSPEMIQEIISKEDGLLKDAVVADGMEEKAGKTCYKLECTIPAEEHSDILSEIMDVTMEGSSGDIEIAAYVGEEDFLLYGMDIFASIDGSMEEGVEGSVKCEMELSMDEISYDEVAIEIPEDVLAVKDRPVEELADEDGDEDDGNAVDEITVDEGDDHFEMSEEIPVAEGEEVVVGGDDDAICFVAPTDMTDTTFDRSSDSYRSYSIGEGGLSVSIDRYSTVEENLEFDMEYYGSEKNKDDYANVGEITLKTPLGDAKGVYYQSVWDASGETSVSYTTACVYVGVDDVCYSFEYTIYDAVEKEDMEAQLQSILDTASTK